MEGLSYHLDALLEPYNSHIIDQKGNLFETKISLDTENEFLSISRKYPTSPTDSTLDSLFHFQKLLRIGAKHSKNPDVVTRRNRDSVTSISGNLTGGIRIPLFEIQEIRLLEYDSKCVKVSSDALKKLRPMRTGSGKYCVNKFRVLKILHGMEFNLHCYNFLVIGLEELSGRKHSSEFPTQKCHLEKWADQIIGLVEEINISRRYFDKLDTWCRNQFKITMETNDYDSLLTMWLRFLQRNHGFTYNGTVRFLEIILRRNFSSAYSSAIDFSEFKTVVRYFVHSHSTISRIFQHFLPSLVYEEQVEPQEENSNELEVLLGNFFSYILMISDTYVPNNTHDVLKNSVAIKETITLFAEKFQKQCTNQVFHENWLSSYYVLDYLYSKHNNIWSPEKLEIYQDMTQPLSHYFIASSHNTYLTGNQYSSESSCEAYVRALRQGCRCIEIDVWNGSRNKPAVKHGHTMTSAVRLKDVLYSIKEHAFVTSPYPVIISIENHCSVKQQKVMAKYFWRVFGKMLHTGKCQKMGNDQQENECRVPSPEELKYKIVLKGRTLPTTPTPKSTGNFKMDVRNSLRRLNKSRDDPTENRSSDISTASHGSSYVEANASEYLLIGELWMCNGDDSQKWVPQIFLLTNKKIICIEERKTVGRPVSRLPSNAFVRQSLTSVQLMQEILQGQMWFHGKLAEGEKDVAALLNKENSVLGSFLVSESLLCPGDCVLSIFYPENFLEAPMQDCTNDVRHLQIKCRITPQNTGTTFYLDEGLTFSSIAELIEYYMKYPLRTPNIELDHLGPPVPVPLTHETEEWFYTDMDQATSEQLLKKLPIHGLFLGRYRNGAGSNIVISFRCENLIKHCRIKQNGRYLEAANIKFRKLEDLVKHFQENAIYKNVKLAHPLCTELYEKAVNGSESVASILENPKYLRSAVKYENTCRVRAIQSFSSSDPDALSFKKGDIIVNVIKEADGWWHGVKENWEGPLTLKQFCSSFVEELDELDCPFEDYVGKSTWKLGVKVKMETCSKKNTKGIKHYIVFEDEKGPPRKLGTTCSLVAKEWVEMISLILEKDDDLKKKLHEKQSSVKYKIAAELSDLVWLPNVGKNLTSDNVVDGPTCSKSMNRPSCVKSLEESFASVSFRMNTLFWILYNQNALTRIYPKRLRLNSSNYNPVTYWNFGSQLVALNYQTPGMYLVSKQLNTGMQVNRGQFSQNGNCGYVLKPNFLLPNSQERNDFDPTTFCGDQCQIMLKVEVIAARHLVKTTSGQINPVVQVEMFGVDADVRKVQTSRQEGGLNPYWGEAFEFQIHCSQLALIHFGVYDEDTFSDKLFLGEATIPVPCARQGYRSVVLKNAHGSELLSRLLVKLTINELDCLNAQN